MKADVIKASILAVLAASLLGATTYFVSQQVVKEEPRQAVTLDAFTLKGGQGLTMVSSPYFRNENISIYALVKDESNVPVTNTSVVFQIYGPQNSNITFEKSAITNASGIAVVNLPAPFELGPPETVIGIWSLAATAQIASGEKIVDTLAFDVEQPPSPYIDVYTGRGGNGSNISSQPYKPGDNVTIYARISDGANPVRNYLIGFSVFKFAENANTTILARTGWSDDSGIALISFTLHPEPTISLGRWQVLTKVMIKGQEYVDTLTFDCINP